MRAGLHISLSELGVCVSNDNVSGVLHLPAVCLVESQILMNNIDSHDQFCDACWSHLYESYILASSL